MRGEKRGRHKEGGWCGEMEAGTANEEGTVEVRGSSYAASWGMVAWKGWRVKNYYVMVTIRMGLASQRTRQRAVIPTR